jgi:hypothetical protein
VTLVFDQYRLEDIARDHPIGAEVFVPFAVARLRGDQEITEATLTVTLRNLGNAGEEQRTLRLSWAVESAPSRPLAVQDRTVTEWAACGVACAMMSLYTGMRVRQVAGDGDRFDYWVDDGKYEYGLEVSGTTRDDLETRHRAKVRQWRDNPYGMDGYVVVVGFATRETIISYHRFQEEVI